ncbi:30S ribosomal protein S5 [[Eubacterium] cellulosolvens]
MSPDETENSENSETANADQPTVTEPEPTPVDTGVASDRRGSDTEPNPDTRSAAGNQAVEEIDSNAKEVDESSESEVAGEVPSKKKHEAVKARGVDKDKKFVTKGEDADFWVPKTKLGRKVKNGEITTMKDALATGLRIREPEIIDILLPDLDDEVLDVNMVQRMTDSGRRVRFAIMTVVGNQNGYVGLGGAKGKEVGPAIRRAIDNAKLNIIEIRRGCGSWECGCDGAHSIPFTVIGKSGSTQVIIRPAPRGVGLAVGDVAKHILRLSGIKDAWGFTRGETRTTINYAKAVFQALQNTAKLKTTEGQIKNLHIVSGAVDLEPLVTENIEDSEAHPETPEE